MNNLIFFAHVLDPQYKFEYISFSLCQMYRDIGSSLCDYVKQNMLELFLDYVASYGQSGTQFEKIPSANASQSQSVSAVTNIGIYSSVLKEKIQKI